MAQDTYGRFPDGDGDADGVELDDGFEPDEGRPDQVESDARRDDVEPDEHGQDEDEPDRTTAAVSGAAAAWLVAAVIAVVAPWFATSTTIVSIAGQPSSRLALTTSGWGALTGLGGGTAGQHGPRFGIVFVCAAVLLVVAAFRLQTTRSRLRRARWSLLGGVGAAAVAATAVGEVLYVLAVQSGPASAGAVTGTTLARSWSFGLGLQLSLMAAAFALLGVGAAVVAGRGGQVPSSDDETDLR
jgi:hypothetical protein